MFSFCDSISAKSVVGVAGGGEEGRVAVIGEKREAIVTCGRSQKARASHFDLFGYGV